jgi:hypothetical protein
MHNVTSQWNQDQLAFTLSGHFCKNRLNAVYDHVKEAVSDFGGSQWCRLIEVTECANFEEEIAHAVNDFHLWSLNSGCYAAAVVIPESRLEDVMSLPTIADDMSNGLRLFFDKSTAELWLGHMKSLKNNPAKQQ